MVLRVMRGFRLHLRTIEILRRLQAMSGIDISKQIERFVLAEARIVATADEAMDKILSKSTKDYETEVVDGRWKPRSKNEGRARDVLPGSR